MKKQKAALADFTENNLPHNRWQVFKDIIKQRYDVLLKIGVILFLFLLPYLIITLLGDITYNAMGEETSREEFAYIDTVISLVNIGPLALLGLGLSGAWKIIRNLVWGEPIFFRENFFSGLRQNRLIFVFVFLILGLVDFLLSYLQVLIPDDLIRTIITALCFVFLIPVAMYLLSAAVLYKDGFWALLKSSVVFFIKTAPISLAFALFFVGIWFIGFIELFIVKVIVAMVSITIMFPVYLVGWTLYSYSVFDKMVNSTLYPDYVDKGIYRIK